MSTAHLGYTTTATTATLLGAAPRESLPALAAALARLGTVRRYRVKPAERYTRFEDLHLVEAEFEGLAGLEPGESGAIALNLADQP